MRNAELKKRKFPFLPCETLRRTRTNYHLKVTSKLQCANQKRKTEVKKIKNKDTAFPIKKYNMGKAVTILDANAKNPVYKTVKETAGAWGVTKRYVNLCIEGGRIPGAMRMGNMWLIPADAQKPARGPRPQQKSLASELKEAVAATTSPLPRDDPDSVLDTSGEERFRLYGEGYLAYLRGDFERTIQCFRKIGGNDALKLRACSLAIAAAISTGNYPLCQEIESYCKNMVLADMGKNVTAVAEFALNTAYVSAFVPNMISNWLKSGDFSDLPHELRPVALCTRTRYFHYLKKYESVLDVAQTALTLYEPEHGISHMSIYLRAICAAACCPLGRAGEAKNYLLDVMRDCLPHGFITPFAEYLPLFGGLLEKLLEREYPGYYDAVIGQSERTVKNWLAFHNRFTKENITLVLSRRDYEIARLAARNVPYGDIAGQFNISVGRLKTIMHEIYGKLFVSNRKELARYIL